MPHALTSVVRKRLADVLMQAAAPDYARFGRGGFDVASNQARLPADDLYDPIADLTPAMKVTRSPSNEVVITVILPQADDFVTFSELAIYDAQGLCIEHATFVPQVLGAGVEAQFTLTLLPEVHQ